MIFMYLTCWSQDFFYICTGHLKDRGFCTPDADEVAALAAKHKQAELDKEIEKVKQEYEEKKSRKDQKRKEKEKDDKDKEKSKDKDEKQKQQEEDKKDEQERDAKVIFHPTTSLRSKLNYSTDLRRSKPLHRTTLHLKNCHAYILCTSKSIISYLHLMTHLGNPFS